MRARIWQSLLVGAGVTLAVALLLARPGAGQPALAQSTGDDHGIVVTGEGSASGQPDLAILSLGVQTDAPHAQDAQSQNARAMAAVIDAIKNQGIDPKDIATMGLSLQPLTRSGQGQAPEVTGYRASNTVRVKVRDLTKAGQVYDAAVAAGANTAGGIQFGFQDDSGLRAQALGDAVRQARAKADTIASAAGVQLGGYRLISEGGVSTPFPRAAMPVGAAPAAGSTPVEPGEQTITMQVQVTFDFTQ